MHQKQENAAKPSLFPMQKHGKDTEDLGLHKQAKIAPPREE